VFDLVIAATPADRAGILERECRDDPGLRARVEAMVAAAEDDRFLAEPTRGEADATPTADLPAAETHRTPTLREGPGSRIGPYKLLQPLGEGGFGSVFMAEQEKPVARRVALKIIKLGMDTHQVVARFEQERQALAMMDHPNIAKVFDAGATETGRPYFVMELVKGDPISEYADKQSMTVEQRLELFAQVCNAVQHAHTKGVIHRDIKPSNVLVSTQDGRPVAKVIDFGIAKATQSKLTEKTLFTEHRQLIGTPEYMSPEQAEGSLDIDTRTDVYSLGVLLYELLTSSTPFSSRQLRSAAYAEIQRIIREVDPPKPSTRLSDNTETLGRVAAQRKTEPRRLGTIVRGELDWIVMKALEKDRQRRYETASGLAADIGRYLNGEAVVAAPPSNAYRMKKFIRRNRWPVAAASMVGVALALGIVGTSVGMWQAVNARAAERARAEGEAAAKEQAQQRLRQVESANELLGSIFSSLNPEKIAESGRPLQAVLAEKISGAIETLEKDPTGDPLTVAKLQAKFGGSLLQLGEHAKAIPLLERALATRTAALGPSDPVTLGTANTLAGAFEGTRQFDKAEALIREIIRNSSGTDERTRNQNLRARRTLGTLLFAQDKTEEALATAAESVEAVRAFRGRDHEDTMMAMNDLGFMYQQLGRADEATKQFEEALRIAKDSLSEEHPRRIGVMNNLAAAYWAGGKLDHAIPIFEDLVAVQLRTLGPDHPRTLLSTGNLGVNYAGAGRHADAIPRLERAWSGAVKHPELNFAGIKLMESYLKTGRTDAARSFAPLYLAQIKATEKPESYDRVTFVDEPALLLAGAGLFAEVEPYADELFAMKAADPLKVADAKRVLARTITKAVLKDEGTPAADRTRFMELAERLVLDAVEQTRLDPQSTERRRAFHLAAVKSAAVVFKDRNKLEPGLGYDQRAAEWKSKADGLASPSEPAEK
jgi:non-specific serine/threonine protein kinase/serine/threonine-protein kinase